MGEIVKASEWQRRCEELEEEILGAFDPNREPGIFVLDNALAESIKRADLREIPDGSKVFVNRPHLNSAYVLRVNSFGIQRVVNIWKQNIYSAGLVGSVGHVYPYRSREDGNVLVEQGVISLDCIFLLPSFCYRDVSRTTMEAFREVLSLDEILISCLVNIWVQFPVKKQNGC